MLVSNPTAPGIHRNPVFSLNSNKSLTPKNLKKKKKNQPKNTAVVSEQSGVGLGICTSVNELTKCGCFMFGCQSAFGS